MRALRIAKSPYLSLACNVAYALGNCVVGFVTHSWWFISVGAYYVVLTTARFAVLQIKRKANGNYDIERYARRVTGVLLVVLSLCIVGVNVLSAIKDRGTDFHKIIMITIATYTFTKITLAIIGTVKAMVIITILWNAVPRSFSADKIFTPTMQNDSATSRIPVTRRANSSVS